jgi:hypothetical protein
MSDTKSPDVATSEALRRAADAIATSDYCDMDVFSISVTEPVFVVMLPTMAAALISGVASFPDVLIGVVDGGAFLIALLSVVLVLRAKKRKSWPRARESVAASFEWLAGVIGEAAVLSVIDSATARGDLRWVINAWHGIGEQDSMDGDLLRDAMLLSIASGEFSISETIVATRDDKVDPGDAESRKNTATVLTELVTTGGRHSGGVSQGSAALPGERLGSRRAHILRVIPRRSLARTDISEAIRNGS